MRCRLTLAVLAGLLAASVLPVSAGASPPIGSFEVHTSSTEAGGHPDLETIIGLENAGQPEVAKDLIINLPEGVFGNPGALTRCSAADLTLQQCPVSSQAGLVTVRALHNGNSNFILGTAPVFSVKTQSSGETARFAFIAPTLDIPVNIAVAVRTGSDYGLRMTVSGISQEVALSFAHMTFWGIPADSAHDFERFPLGSSGSPAGCPGLSDTSCNTIAKVAGITSHPMIDNPSVCSGQPLKVTLDVQSYQDLGSLTHAEDSYPATTGCEKQTFNPVLGVGLTTDEADAPSGLDLQLRADQFETYAASPSQLRSATVTLPEGLSINPDAADGQTSCSDADAHFGVETPAACPDTSKIGTFSILTPALEGPLTGSLYIGEPKPADQYRVYMIASGFGINAKLVASIRPDPLTGQLTLSTDDLPQVPFEQFDLHLFASDRGLIATPTQCTSYEVDSLFIPWNAKLSPQKSTPNFGLFRGPNGTQCPGFLRPFKPRLVAGTSSPLAGAFSSFTLRLDRSDGDQFLGDLNFRMPPGFTGSLRGISYCPEVAIAAAARNLGRAELGAPSCPASSLVGTTNVAAGPGSHPFHAVGRMYLAGPFKGAPLSLAAVTPALAGPYDYGVVVVRVGLHIDPLTAQVSAVSDTVPSIIGGIPIRMRSIQVNIDKPNFTINPTNCAASTIDSQGIGDQGSIADFSSYFHAVNCSLLGFRPRMTIRQVGGRKGTRRASNPTLQIDMRTRPGDANIKSLAVILSRAFAIDQRHLGNVCSESELVKTQCAGRQAMGQAMTRTPLLDQAIAGPVYAVSGSGGLPRLAFLLNGQVSLVPRAESDTLRDGRLRTIVPVVPDAPIGHFTLNVFGGRKGYLVNTRSLCAQTPVIQVVYTAQNGRKRTEAIPLKTSCGSGSKRGAKVHRMHKR